MDKFQQEAVSLALDKMFNQSSHFSICVIDKLAKNLGVNCESHPDYKVLNTLHCVHYTEMSAEMKAELPNKVMNVLSAKFEVGLMAKALAAVANGEIKDLPPIEDAEVGRSGVLRLLKG